MNPLVWLAVMSLTTLTLIVLSFCGSSRMLKFSIPRLLSFSLLLFASILLFGALGHPTSSKAALPTPTAVLFEHKRNFIRKEHWETFENDKPNEANKDLEAGLDKIENSVSADVESGQKTEAVEQGIVEHSVLESKEEELEKFGLIRRRTLGQSFDNETEEEHYVLRVQNDCELAVMVHISDSARGNFLDWIYVPAKSQSVLPSVPESSDMFAVTIYVHDGKSSSLPRLLCISGSSLFVVGQTPHVSAECLARGQLASAAFKFEQKTEKDEHSAAFGDGRMSDFNDARIEKSKSREGKRVIRKISSVAAAQTISSSTLAADSLGPVTLKIENGNDTLNGTAEIYDFFSGKMLESLFLPPRGIVETRIHASMYLIRASISLYLQGDAVVTNAFPPVYCKPGGRVMLHYTDDPSVAASTANSATCDSEHLPGSPLIIRNRSDLFARLLVRDISSGAVLHEVYVDGNQDMDLLGTLTDLPPYFSFQLFHTDMPLKPGVCRFGAELSVLGKTKDADVRARCDDDHRVAESQVPTRVKILNGSGYCPVPVRVLLPGDDGIEERLLDEFTLPCGESGSSWLGPEGKRKVQVKVPKEQVEDRQITCSGTVFIGDNGLYC